MHFNQYPPYPDPYEFLPDPPRPRPLPLPGPLRLRPPEPLSITFSFTNSYSIEDKSFVVPRNASKSTSSNVFLCLVLCLCDHQSLCPLHSPSPIRIQSKINPLSFHAMLQNPLRRMSPGPHDQSIPIDPLRIACVPCRPCQSLHFSISKHRLPSLAQFDHSAMIIR